jgi:hypothetical protein
MLLWRSSVYHIHSTCYVAMEIFCIPHTIYKLCCYGDLPYTTYICGIQKIYITTWHVECMWCTEDLHNNITCRMPHTFYMLCCYGDLLYTTYILHVMLLWRSSVYHIHSTCYFVMEIFCIPHTFYILCWYGDLLYITYILHVMNNITCRMYVVYGRSP